MQNVLAITGRITRDPELKSMNGGELSYCNFSLAVTRDFKEKRTGEYETDFIDCVAWRQSANYLGQYGGKGDTVSVVGRLQIDNWEDDQGVKRRSAKVQVQNLYIVSRKEDRQNNADNGGGYGSTNKGYGGNNGGGGSGYGGGGGYGGQTTTSPESRYAKQQDGTQGNDTAVGDQYECLTSEDEGNLPF